MSADDVQTHVLAHARRIVAGDDTAHADLATGAEVNPPDLLDRLRRQRFATFQIVAHARIGAYHFFKTRYAGPTTVVVQTRWVEGPAGAWRIHEAEVTRVAEAGA